MHCIRQVAKSSCKVSNQMHVDRRPTSPRQVYLCRVSRHLLSSKPIMTSLGQLLALSRPNHQHHSWSNILFCILRQHMNNKTGPNTLFPNRQHFPNQETLAPRFVMPVADKDSERRPVKRPRDRRASSVMRVRASRSTTRALSHGFPRQSMPTPGLPTCPKGKLCICTDLTRLFWVH